MLQETLELSAENQHNDSHYASRDPLTRLGAKHILRNLPLTSSLNVELRAHISAADHDFVHKIFSREASEDRVSIIYQRLLTQQGPLGANPSRDGDLDDPIETRLGFEVPCSDGR